MPSEFELIDAFLSAFPKLPPPEGPGDDCAVLRPAQGRDCVTTDAVVEGVHFTREHFSLEDVGHKALAVNLSDLAAMGARPRWFVCALGLPRGFTAPELRALARGMSRLAAVHRIRLVGGNLTAAPVLCATITAAGEVAPERVIRRAGGKPGDLLYVSGTLGDARAGLELLGQGVRGKGARLLADRQRRPTPRVALGQLASRYARAGIDLSDGLAQDLGHLCRASGVGASVSLSRLPVSDALRGLLGDERAAQAAAAGGEDYELLLAVPPRRASAFERAAARQGERVTQIGQLRPQRGVVFLTAGGGMIAPPSGYDHFRAC